MSTSHTNSLQLTDKQIEDLVSEYSQLEVNSQVILESQTQCCTEEMIPVQPPLANQDFQAEFLKCMFNENQIQQIASNVRANADTNTQQDFDSQTDIETVVRTYITDNPNWNEHIESKQFDIETFLETRDFFVTVKTGIGKQSSEQHSNQNKVDKEMSNRFTLGPLPLEIEDIHRIIMNLDEAQLWNSYQKIYGQRFKTVMFYGRCKPCGSTKAQKDRNVRLYEIDDGSGMVIVHFPHFDTNYAALSYGIERLLDEYALAQKEGIPYLGTEHCHPNSDKCKEMLQNVNILINIIRRNGAIKQEFFTHGCKVCVIGRVFSHNDGTNHVFAYNMIEDSGVNREFEIKFKQHLISVYKMKYLKYNVNGGALNK